MKPLRVVSLFAGAGGLEIALCQTLPVEAIISTDSNATFLRTTQVNMPSHFPNVRHSAIAADVRTLQGKDFLDRLGGQCDLVMGGPPCDDFTKYGRRLGLAGDKGPLIFEFARLILEIKPSVFLFENVPNILRAAAKGYGDMQTILEQGGYKLAWKKLRADHFGAPTVRERIFLWGISSKKDHLPSFPEPTHAPSTDSNLLSTIAELKKCVTVGEVLGSLPDTDSPEANNILNHVPRRHRPGTIEGFKNIPPGGFERGSYRYRAPWSGPCWSLTAGLDDSTKAHLHPCHHREMTVREYARIHGFPDTWHFAGTNENGTKQVANSVPIALGQAVISRLYSCFIV